MIPLLTLSLLEGILLIVLVYILFVAAKAADMYRLASQDDNSPMKWAGIAFVAGLVAPAIGVFAVSAWYTIQRTPDPDTELEQ